MFFDHSIISLVPTLLYGPDTVGRHQQWEVPAPTLTFTPRSYTHFMPIHKSNCLPNITLIISCPNIRDHDVNCNYICWREKSYL